MDPFMGSAPVGVAALEAERRFAGNDASAIAMGIASERLRACRFRRSRTE